MNFYVLLLFHILHSSLDIIGPVSSLICVAKNSTASSYPPPHSLERSDAVAQLFEALRYKPEGPGFDVRWCHLKFSLTSSFRLHYVP